MSAQGEGRRCRCGTRLARDNRGSECHACQQAARDHRLRPPRVPAEFWASPEMRTALASRDMGMVMRAFRTHPLHGSDIPQEVAAGWVGLSQSGLSRIERGEHAFTETKLMRWAHVLGIPGDVRWFAVSNKELLAVEQHTGSNDTAGAVARLADLGQGGSLLLPVLVEGRPVLVPVNLGSVAGEHLATAVGTSVATASEWDSMSPLDRRAFLRSGIAAAALPTLGLDELHHVAKALGSASRYLDSAVVDYFRQQLAACAADDGALGPKKTLPAVLAVIQAVEQHARDVQPAVRRELLAVGAQGAEFAGWLFRDARDPIQASYWRDRAIEWAQEAGDTAMQGYVLLKKAQAAYDDRDALRMLTLAQAVQDGPWDLPTKVRAEAAQQEARGHAMLGADSGLIEHKLTDAHQLLSDAEHDAATDDRPLGVHYNATLLTMQTAICYCEAGQPRRAVELYDTWLSAQTFSRRDYGYFRALMASSLALAGEPDTAATTGLEALSVAQETASQRTTQELTSVVDVLRPWANRPVVRELREAVLT
jgi:Helix-turn-helix domain